MGARKGWGIEVLNLHDSLKAFERADAAFGAAPLKDCLMIVALKVRDRAKGLVNRTSGKRPHGAKSDRFIHLRDAIFATGGKPNHPSVIVGVDRKKAPHAHLVEFGHGGPHPAPPHPFLRPAFQAIRRSAAILVGKEVTERIIKKLTTKQNSPRIYSGVTDVTDLVEKYGPGVPVGPGEIL